MSILFVVIIPFHRFYTTEIAEEEKKLEELVSCLIK